MPVDQATPRPTARSRDDAKLVKYHDFIDEKIDSTRRLVKVVDLATALVELLVAVLLFLLFAIVAEHWLVPGGLPAAVRVILFLVLGVGCGYFAYRRLWPLCVKAINPVYAAQTIEHGAPTLKNGLVNLLLFRDKRAEITDAVYHTLEEQAAHGLTRVPVDVTVDQTELIRLGYVLVGIVAVMGLYKVFSPKDPFVAAERVLMPWSNILPASRVTISDVKPGTETFSQGEVVEVSADVRGLNDDDTVVVRYSTEDGQIVGRAITLKASADKLRFQAKLADGAEGAVASGVTRNLKYHLEAGDARSLTYSITVVPAATISVERVDYHYPKYTGLVDQSVDGIGDLRAIEGTKVTIHARANGAIREASVDFDADGRPDLQMVTEDAKAHVEFELGLRDDRQTPKHASYLLQFTNAEGRRNHDPVKYSINVEPDRQPEVEIRQPLEKSRDAQLDETVNIEVEARDPDFSLSAVRLRGQVSGREVVNEPLLKEEHRGSFDGRLALVPGARGLKEGEVLEYWAEADDNRTPKPNSVATEHKTLRIVSTNPAQHPPQDRLAKNDRQQPQNGGQSDKNQQQKGEQNQKNQQGEQGKSGDQPSGGENGKGQQNQGGQGKQGQGQQDQGQQGQSQQGQGQGEKQQGDQSQSGQSNGEQQSGGGDQNKQSSGLKQNETGSGGGDKANQHDGQGQGGEVGGQSASNDPSSKKPDQKGENKQTGAGAAGGESSKDGAQPGGARPDANRSEKENSSGSKSNSGDQKNGQQQSGEQQKGQKGDGQTGEPQSAVSSEGDADAEAFNRIQKQMEKSGELKPGENSKKDEGDKGEQGDSQGAKKENSSGGHKSQSGEDKSGAQGSGAQQKDSASGKKSNSQQEQGANSKPDEKGQSDKGQGKKGQDDKGQGAQSRQDDSKQGQSSSGNESSTNGSAGGGNEERKQGSPNSQPGMKPTEKTEQAGSKGEKKDSPEPAAGANGKKESDSHGDQGGDKAGRGSEGGGQKSPHDGTGSTGENQSADTGSGQSGEQGKGDTSNAGGKDVKSDHPTGSTDGKTQGKGGEQRDGKGDKAGGDKGNEQGAGGGQSKQGQANQNGDGVKQSQGDKSQGDKQGQDGKNAGDKGADQQAAKNGDGQSGNASDQKSEQPQNGKDGGSGTQQGSGGSGEPGNAVNPQVSITGEAPEGDAANLEYARKQTDLVVGKLADQLSRKRVDKDLLKELGWSEADLKRFVDRWQQRKAAAEQGNESGDAAKRELDDALRSLGLRPGELRQNAVQKDSMRDLHEGYRGPVPAEYKDRLRAYNQGVSRAHADDK